MPRGRGSKKLSSKRAKASLALMLHGCTDERLASFTPQSLCSSWNVSLATVEQMLANARQGRMA